MKSSGAACCSLLAETLHELNYVPSKADPDVYMQPAVKPNGFEYYEYVLCYVDEILSISHWPDATMNGIRARFTLKDDKVEEPTNYLEAQLSKMKDEFGNEFWNMSSSKYCKAAITNVRSRFPLLGSGYQPSARRKWLLSMRLRWMLQPSWKLMASNTSNNWLVCYDGHVKLVE